MFSGTETGYGQSVHSCKELVQFATVYMHLSNVTCMFKKKNLQKNLTKSQK